MIDFSLARKFMNSIQKSILNAMQHTDEPDVTELLKSAYGKMDLLYDILHISDIDLISTNNATAEAEKRR